MSLAKQSRHQHNVSKTVDAICAKIESLGITNSNYVRRFSENPESLIFLAFTKPINFSKIFPYEFIADCTLKNKLF